MIRPDAIPVTALGPSVQVDAAGVVALFGRSYTLRGMERVRLVRLGQDAGLAPVALGPPGVRLDAATADALGGLDGVRLAGPYGSLAAPPVALVAARLRLPAGLRRAWNVPDTATVAIGPVAVSVAVTDAPEAGVDVDRALWLAAGRPATARWLPGVTWASETEEMVVDSVAITGVVRRVVTETDVRQARLRGQTIRLAPGQVVTPAARSLAHEWNVFEPSGDGPAPSRPGRY